jgi:hypothetical protein
MNPQESPVNRLAFAVTVALALPFASPVVMAASPTASPAAAAAVSAAPSAAPKPWAVNLRYRYEGVDDDALSRDADAHTARLRAGYTFAFGGGWSALLEGEGVAELNDRFNSGANGETSYPTVIDARALEINQAWVDWRGADLGTRVGRQMIVLDNARFIGNGAWRQNMQTFDAVQLQWKPSAAWDVQAFYLDAIQRSAGDNARDRLARERDLDGRLLRVSRIVPGGNVAAYGYWVEDEDVAAASTRTLGLRWSSAWALNPTWKLGLTLEGATQQPWADAAGGRTGYALLEPRLERGPLVFKAGFERLGAGSGRAFQTPLATLHAFNGWADKFTTTPINGLEDRYLSAQGTFTMAGKAASWQVMAHDFQSDRGADYGTEWDASLALTLRPGLVALAKLADYQSDGFARDTRKLWLQLEWAL